MRTLFIGWSPLPKIESELPKLRMYFPTDEIGDHPINNINAAELA